MYYDSLTGLPNAVLFVDRLQHALAHAARSKQELALVYLDIDGFRSIVEEYGKDAGDKVLLRVAERLQGCALRQEDTIARLCGDQFLMVLGDICGVVDAKKVLDKIMDSMKPAFPVGDCEVTVKVSVGVSLFPQDGREWSPMLRRASLSMQQAKKDGGNKYVCYGEGGRVSETRLPEQQEGKSQQEGKLWQIDELRTLSDTGKWEAYGAIL